MMMMMVMMMIIIIIIIKKISPADYLYDRIQSTLLCRFAYVNFFCTSLISLDLRIK